jgi:hypothetical protein
MESGKANSFKSPAEAEHESWLAREVAQRIAGHADSRTTKFDRRGTAFAGIPAGTEIIINDPTNALVFCADSTKNLDQIMSDAEAQDWDALKELISEGHLLLWLCTGHGTRNPTSKATKELTDRLLVRDP